MSHRYSFSLFKDVILKQPELVFEGYRLSGDIMERKRDVIRKLAHFLRKENFQFTLEDKVCFEEQLEERDARAGLIQIFQESDLIGGDADDADKDIVMEEDEYLDALLGDGDKDEAVEEAVAEENAIDEREADDDESILDMFLMNAELPVNPKGGPRSTWNTKFIELATNLIASGDTAASCHTFFATTAHFYPELLGDNKLIAS